MRDRERGKRKQSPSNWALEQWEMGYVICLDFLVGSIFFQPARSSMRLDLVSTPIRDLEISALLYCNPCDRGSAITVPLFNKT